MNNGEQDQIIADIATQNLDYDYKLKELNAENWKEKTAQYKIYNEPQLDIKEKELCKECKYLYNVNELKTRLCLDCYKELKTECKSCKQPTPKEYLKNDELTVETEEFNFEKIERTEIEQIKQEIKDLQKMVLNQDKNIKYLTKAIKIHQEINNSLHQDNLELKRKFE
ncbi:9838_t:CDS:2 [Racocetra persica]|uniref:9838_t:CDS:1 n=1 Tax=Racocetra persica TaxID=160502 RepID=A0ACA9LS23_9GLOM|nr:9838_t:CDS:2 [Racocetra persica]